MTGRALGRQLDRRRPRGRRCRHPPGGKSATGFDLGGGIYYTSPNLWLGSSSTQLPETELKDVSIQNVRHYYVQAGYDWASGGNKKYHAPAQHPVKSDATSTQLDLSAIVPLRQDGVAGASYRTEDAIAPMIGYQMSMGKPNEQVCSASATATM
jgi:hypothetical protein